MLLTEFLQRQEHPCRFMSRAHYPTTPQVSSGFGYLQLDDVPVAGMPICGGIPTYTRSLGDSGPVAD